MKLKKPKFWNKGKSSILPYILLPLSILLQILNSVNKLISKKKSYQNIKTICVGNIYVGGTGKTSLSMKLYEIFSKKNIKTCFIKKDYSNQKDEQKILENKGKLFKSKKRAQSLQEAIYENYEIAIFDDGLQDHSINYDLTFVCFNNLNWIGNGFTIPSGPLRESFKTIKDHKNIFVTGNLTNLESIKKEILKINPQSNILTALYVPLNLHEFDKKEKYLVFSGIGNHESFVSMLKSNGLNIIKDLEFPDHYYYSDQKIYDITSQAKKLNCKILTTEKDFLRLKGNNSNEIKFIKSELKINNENDFLNILSDLYE